MTLSFFDLPERFQDKIMPEPMSGCWLWTANRTHDGYATVWWDRTTRRAARVILGWAIGELPRHLQTDHLCKNRICVNPAHLEAVTAAENTRRADGGLAGRMASIISRSSAAFWDCPNGHKKEGTNLVINSRGARCCRLCLNKNAADFRLRKRIAP